MASNPRPRPADDRTRPDISHELAARRTGMSFQRTRLSADRTLMSVIRTSLALIGFGFTIYQIFEKAHDAQILSSGTAARHLRRGPGVPRHRHAGVRHRLPHRVHDRTSPRTPAVAGR